MANVLQPHIDFGPRPASHAASPFGFGFGLGLPAASAMVAGWQLPPTPGHTNPSAFQQLATSVNQNSPSRPLKRRHEPHDDAQASKQPRDHSMDRSPTPERPKRAAPKRARVAPVSEDSNQNEGASKESKTHKASDGDDIDVGVLLGQCLTWIVSLVFHGYVFSKSPIRVTTPLIDIITQCTTFIEIYCPTIDSSPYG